MNEKLHFFGQHIMQDVYYVFAALAAIFAISFLFINYFYPLKEIKADKAKLLNQKESREILVKELCKEGNAFQRYQIYLLYLNEWGNRWFGAPQLRQSRIFNKTPLPYLTGSAFKTCMTIAFVYPLFAFLLAWVAGGSGSIGQLKLMPDIANEFYRCGVFIALMMFSWIFYVYSSGKLEIWIEGKLSDGFVAKIRRFIKSANRVNVASAFAFAFAATATATAFAFAAAFAATAFAAAAVAVAAYYSKTDANYNQIIILITFFYILPLVNVIFDYLSLAATRWFIALMAKRKNHWGKWIIIAEIAIDLAFALACLAGLAFLMAFALEVLNIVLAKYNFTQIDWQAMIKQAVDYPFSKGLSVTLLLATTIAPTFLHIVFGLAGIFMFAETGKKLAREIENALLKGEAIIEYHLQKLVDRLVFRKTKAWALAIAASLALFAMGYFAIDHLYSFATMLKNITNSASELAHSMLKL